MEAIANENLFLLEFLVDKVHLDPCVCEHLTDVMGETCVSVQFLDNAAMDVCEDDFSPRRDYYKNNETLKSGKSCLFAMSPAQACEAADKFDIFVTIFKKMQPDILPEKVAVGQCLISIVNLFNDLIDSLSGDNTQQPAAKTLKDTFNITDDNGQLIGDIDMYIRMSCFGKLIVTQFQMNLEDESVLFKDKEGHSLYRYKKATKKSCGPPEPPETNLECPLWNRATGNRNANCPTVSCFDEPPPPCPPPSREPQCAPAPDMDPLCQECVYAPELAPPPQIPVLPGCYQEIGAQMGGNALTIRVHKDKNRVEQVDSFAQVEQKDGSCCCTPGNVGNWRKSSNANRNTCQTEPQEMAMRPGVPGANNDNSPFAFKMAGCGGAASKTVTVVPPVCTGPDGTQFTELSDPDRDVFILRIGKKSEGTNKKNNLELELCTPKGPELKPIPKKETRDTQYDVNDAGADGGSGTGGKKGKNDKKGKGGKGAKGKKGKK